jgi:hypothetical protein
MKFMLMEKSGSHWQDGRTYFPGDVIETDKRLDEAFPNKFLPVAADTPTDCPVFPSFVVSEDGYYPGAEGMVVKPPARVYVQFTHPTEMAKRPSVVVETYDETFGEWRVAVDVARTPQAIERFIQLTQDKRVRLHVTGIVEPVRMEFKPRWVW